MGKARYSYFWGCQIPARLPFLEKSTRLILQKLGVDAADLDGFTCCPEKSLVKNMDEESWLLTAARNLAVAEKSGKDLLVACNGCYGTLQTVYMKLVNNPLLKSKINERLKDVGLSFEGNLRIKHLLDVLYNDVGIGVIKKNIVRPMQGIKIAVHYGCHLLRPSNTLRFDDPLKPHKYDLLVEALGAKSIAYSGKMNCCGGGLNQGGEGEEAMAMARKKLLDVQMAKADLLTTVCPQCFMQYDQKQAVLQKRGEKLQVPVLTYSELLGLALGFSPEELGLDGHRVELNKFFTTWEKKEKVWQTMREKINLAEVEKCYECGACLSDCPVAQNHSSFHPKQILERFLAGEVEELIAEKEIWRCVECHTCSEMCGQKFGMEKVFSFLKHLSIENGTAPQEVQRGLKVFWETARLGEPSQQGRKKLGLDPAPESGQEQLKKLLQKRG